MTNAHPHQGTRARGASKKMKIAAVVAAPLLMFTGCVAGTAIGASGSDDSASASDAPTVTVTETATPEPAPTVTETAEPEPAPTVTETAEPEIETVIEEVEVEVETVPLSCTEAIEAGDVLIESLLSWGDYVTPAEMELAEDAAFDWGFWSEVCKDAAG